MTELWAEITTNTTIAEWVWSLVSFAAIVLHVLILYWATKYLLWLQAERLNGPRLTAATFTIAIQSVFLIGQVTFAGVGVTHLLTPPVISSSVEGHTIRTTSTLAVVAGQSCFALAAFLTAIMRAAVSRAITIEDRRATAAAAANAIAPTDGDRHEVDTGSIKTTTTVTTTSEHSMPTTPPDVAPSVETSG